MNKVMYELLKSEGLLVKRILTDEEAKDHKSRGYEVFHDFNDNEYFIYEKDSEMTKEDYQMVLFLKHVKFMRIIKNCALFFTILTIVSIAIFLLMLVF